MYAIAPPKHVTGMLVHLLVGEAAFRVLAEIAGDPEATRVFAGAATWCEQMADLFEEKARQNGCSPNPIALARLVELKAAALVVVIINEGGPLWE